MIGPRGTRRVASFKANDWSAVMACCKCSDDAQITGYCCKHMAEQLSSPGSLCQLARQKILWLAHVFCIAA